MLLRLSLVLALLPAVGLAQKKTREQKVREDKARIEAEGFWIYNDLESGIAQAKETGKPLLIVLRCLPCEECVKLDDELIDQDPVVRPLLDKFVCVRIVGTNGLDLETFQYDTDQSFAVFLLNADKTIYGRFGTRSHRTEWVGDVSVAGLARALEGALELHADYPANKASLAGKRGPQPLFPSPENYPSLRDKYTDTLNYKGDVVKSCIHCHQIGDAERDYYRSRGEPIPEQIMFPYPHPRDVGLILDPRQPATVKQVLKDSPADHAGFREGDDMATLAGQPLLSMADVQWVLHQTDPNGAQLQAEVERGGGRKSLTLDLDAGWRKAGDISWRSSSWGLRRMAAGGLRLEDLDPADRRRLGIPPGSMALFTKHLGQYGPHGTAKRSGFRQGDVLVEFDGRTDLLREADLHHYAMTKRKPGDRVDVVVVRNGQRKTLQLPMQK